MDNNNIEEVVKDNNNLKMINAKLNEELAILRKNIQTMQDNMGYEICEYFNKYNSIRRTTEQYFFESVLDCHEALVEYFGCSDPLQSADDYKECYREIFNRDYDSENDDLENDDLEDENSH